MNDHNVFVLRNVATVTVRYDCGHQVDHTFTKAIAVVSIHRQERCEVCSRLAQIGLGKELRE